MNPVDQYFLRLLEIFVVFLAILFLPARRYYKQLKLYNKLEEEHFARKEQEVADWIAKYDVVSTDSTEKEPENKGGVVGPDSYEYTEDGETKVTKRGESLYNMIYDTIGTGEIKV